MALCALIPWQGDFHSQVVYEPKKQPGFVAWATAFSYGDGTVGLSFDETTQEKNVRFVPPRIEYAEASGVPVSYGSIEGGSADKSSYRVYMRSTDGLHFTQTGRCARSEGSMCNLGFADGRILGFDVPRRHENGVGWSDAILVRESKDGGNTWTFVRALLRGTAPYLWRARRLKDETIILLASLYGTKWGPSCERTTRNTMLPDETYISKISTFFITSVDGKQFSEPHYILPGIGAHEFDFVELPDGRLLFIAGDVQGTPVGRQFVTPSPDGWLNGPLLPIGRGAPENPSANPQGGYIPETIVFDAKEKCMVGYRRNKGFSISNDLGRNWTLVQPDFPYAFLYQPFLMALEDGSMALYGHVGGDNAFGENVMHIEAQKFSLTSAAALPKAPVVSLERMLSPDQSHYVNAFRAQLLVDNEPLNAQTLEFRVNAYWNSDGSVNTTPQNQAPLRILACTDLDGYAYATVEQFNAPADIHLAYTIDVVCLESASVASCVGPMMTVLAMTPRRRTLFPFDAYLVSGILYLSPDFLKDYPEAIQTLHQSVDNAGVLQGGALSENAVKRLVAARVMTLGDDGNARFLPSVHAERPFMEARAMVGGDWYE